MWKTKKMKKTKKEKSGYEKTRPSRSVVRRRDIDRQYQRRASFSDKLPWLEWSDDEDMVLLEDGQSVGAAFELKAIACEARPAEVIEKLHADLSRLLSKLLPLENENPWVMQLFVQDELSLEPVAKVLEHYIAARTGLDDPLAQTYLALMQDHFKAMCSEQGILRDPLSDLPFRGKIRRIRLTLYRRYDQGAKLSLSATVAELSEVCDRFVPMVRQLGVKLFRLKAPHFYQWLVRWFNPKPDCGDVDMLLKSKPYLNKKPFGWSMTQNTLFGTVEADESGWWFDGVKHKVFSFAELDGELDIGAISLEKNFGDKQKYAVLDKLPAGAIYTLQVTFESKLAVNSHLDGIKSAAIGKGDRVKSIHKNVETAFSEMDKGHWLFRCAEGLYLCGEDDQAIKKQVNEITPLLEKVQLRLIANEHELFPADVYLRFLPFNFSHHFDKHHNFRSTYKYADDVAKLLPLYGRSIGDGVNPLHIFYNRGGEVFMFDHLSRDFKSSNSHMFIGGTTGSGKSVVLNNMCFALSAVYNPRIIVMEVGQSFALSAQYFETHGRKVSRLVFDRLNPTPVNPYAEAYLALEMIEKEEAAVAAREKKRQKLLTQSIALDDVVLGEHSNKLESEIESRTEPASEKELGCNEDRDLLNEMVIATRVMITQGDKKEEEKLDPTDLSLITRSLVHAMRAAKALGAEQMLLTHVIASMNELGDAEKNDALQERLKIFALRLEYYTTGIRGEFINQPSEPLGDFDFLHVDFGFMQSESYKDLLNIVSISLLSKLLALAEANKDSGRPTELFIDEAHVFFKSAMVSAFIILMAKVARKIGLWLKLCTQNIHDFTDIEAKKVLSMMETWLCLSFEKDEIKKIESFKTLTPEMKEQLAQVVKFPGIYSEGVLIGKRHTGLFRNVPPRLSLALAMTEQDERSRRRELREKYHITELEAVEKMATEITAKKVEDNDDKYFQY